MCPTHTHVHTHMYTYPHMYAHTLTISVFNLSIILATDGGDSARGKLSEKTIVAYEAMNQFLTQFFERVRILIQCTQ